MKSQCLIYKNVFRFHQITLNTENQNFIFLKKGRTQNY